MAIRHVAEDVNTDRPQLQLHRVLHSRGISQFTLLPRAYRPPKAGEGM